MHTNISLRQLRRYANKTQAEAARLAEITQSELSRFERRDDFRLSTLRRYVAALGGRLELTVSFGSSAFRLVPEPTGDAEHEELGGAVDALESLSSWLPALVGRLSRSKLGARLEGCGRYSLAEHVCHLHDVEHERYATRLHRVLSEDEPRLREFHADWTDAGLGSDRSIAPALRDLVRARRRHVLLLRGLDARTLRRAAVLDGVGRLTLATLIRRWSSHDLGHRLELERLAERLRS